MLFKAFGVQLVFGTIFIFSPITVFLMVYVLQVPDASSITISCLHLGIYNGLLEFPSMTYFITPYRNFIINSFRFARCQKTKTVVYPVSHSSV